MKIFKNLRLSIIVNILALMFFVSPFYPNGCSKKTPTPVDSVMPDSISSSTSADTIISLNNDTADSISKADSINLITSSGTVIQTQNKNKLIEGLKGVMWGDGNTITGFSCIVCGMSSYIGLYGIITAFLFLLICLMLKNTYEKRKFIIIVILELISIPFLFFTNFDIFFIKAIPYEKLWGFWVCFALVIILFLIDIAQIIKRERRNKKNGC